MHIAVLFKNESFRSKFIAQSMYSGLKRHQSPHLSVTLSERSKYRNVGTDVIVAYGWIPFKDQFNQQIRRGGKYVFADLGFWGRKTKTLSSCNQPLDAIGFHKLSINYRHPVNHLFRDKPADRFNRFNLSVKDWRKGEHILIVGMSAKAARSYGYDPQEWEKSIIDRLRKVTDRRIIYRSKPGDITGRPIPGVEYFDPSTPFSRCLRGAHAVVSRHSNASVEALLEGIQVYCEDNVGQYMSMKTLEDINDYHWPEGREGFMNNVAYTQWSPKELTTGEWFDDYKGLIYA